MKRRHVLRSLPVVAGLSLAGCSSVLGSGTSGTVLGKTQVINFSFASNRIHLTVERDDETLIERNIRLGAIDAEDGVSWRVIEPSWSETQARYTIRAFHVSESGSRESEAWEYTFTQEDYGTYYGDSHEDPGCIGAVVKIGSPNDKENGTIGIGPTYMGNPCKTPNPR